MATYPFTGMAPYPRDQWYLAAWSGEIGRKPLERTILGHLLILYRTESGRATALAGLCPHRWMPLARGRLEGDRITCAYHGLVVDADGQCRNVPGNRQAGANTDNCRVRAFPLVEKAPCLWIWPGDPVLADPATIPDIGAVGLTGSGWHVDLDPPVLVRARAQLLLENLFDQSHIAFVHPQSLAGGNALPAPAELVVEDDAARFRVNTETPVVRSDASVKAVFPGAGPFVRTRMQSELLGVSLVNSVGSQTFNATAEGAFLAPLGRINFLHGVTPETPHSTHYFTALTRNFKLDDAALSATLVARNRTVVREDVTVLEAIEPGLDAHADPKNEFSFASDKMAMRVRRRIAQLIRAERTQPAATAEATEN